ncbi:hypothetical protein KFL_017050020 [Klebsormidium nitens]|uniref:Uncharacterized protein n=1 Tax=Klebsormidium nitens TaxID=105231 RepID=A0A1Y1IVF4_KLENI|nr:hypothetical protein KFL_017050020 [Klebsormidium nitens]|eukprot:GAQ93609.1 hypothetical protein KFL_017050020 [Klebsormidium nitens]
MSSPWPLRSDAACWWCCHQFDTIPIPLPVHYDEARNVFQCMGTFCSFGCAKAFNLSRNSVKRDRTCTLLTLFRNKVIKKDASYPLWNSPDSFGIRAAGDRYSLRLFGGPKSIEEFREGMDVLVHESEADALSNVSVQRSREVGVIYQPDLGLENRQKSFLEGHDEYDTTEAFETITSEGHTRRGRKRKGEATEANTKRGTALLAIDEKKEAQILSDIREGTAIKNQPYKLKRSLPLPRENSTLFSTMKIEIQPRPGYSR